MKSAWALKKIGRGKVAIANGDLSSASERTLLDMLESIYSVKIERQFPLFHRYYDGRFGQYLIEVDGSRWHSKPSQQKLDKWKNRIAERNGFKLVRIKLDSVKEIPVVIENNKAIFEEIFSGR